MKSPEDGNAYTSTQNIHPDAGLLVETSSSVFIVCIEEHFQSVILDVGIADYFLGDGLVVGELFLHL